MSLKAVTNGRMLLCSYLWKWWHDLMLWISSTVSHISSNSFYLPWFSFSSMKKIVVFSPHGVQDTHHLQKYWEDKERSYTATYLMYQSYYWKTKFYSYHRNTWKYYFQNIVHRSATPKYPMSARRRLPMSSSCRDFLSSLTDSHCNSTNFLIVLMMVTRNWTRD